MSVTLTITAEDGATSQIALSDPVIRNSPPPPPPPQSTSIFTTQTPALVNQSDGPTSQYELGLKFKSSVPGSITGIRFWKGSAEASGHIGSIWSSSGTKLATVTFANETPSGWQVQSLVLPVPVTANTIYIVSVGTTNTNYCAQNNGLTAVITNLQLSTIVGPNGVYSTTRGAFPTLTWQASNYFRDVVFVGGPPPPPDTIAPSSPTNLRGTPL
jgi:Domain of unknown function (DUF4082)